MNPAGSQIGRGLLSFSSLPLKEGFEEMDAFKVRIHPLSLIGIKDLLYVPEVPGL